MSGHSKWHSIRHKKGAVDAKRGKLFSKLTRAIIVAAREGGPDPDNNLALQNAIEKARENSMPKDTIERAVARGAGTDSDAEAYEQVTYEEDFLTVMSVTRRVDVLADAGEVFRFGRNEIGNQNLHNWLNELLAR